MCSENYSAQFHTWSAQVLTLDPSKDNNKNKKERPDITLNED